MQLIGMLDSPYVRRVAISLKYLNIPFEHRPLSVFRNFDQFSQVNPIVKAPSLVCEDEEVLLDSTLILEYLEALTDPAKSLMPTDLALKQKSLRLIGLALAACDKTVQIVYEHDLRPDEKLHQPWVDRVTGQLIAAYDFLEKAVANLSWGKSLWLVTDRPMQPDITVCVAWRFTQFMIPDVVKANHYPALGNFSAKAEQLPEFLSTPLE